MLLARSAAGSMRDGLGLLDNVFPFVVPPLTMKMYWNCWGTGG